MCKSISATGGGIPVSATSISTTTTTRSVDGAEGVGASDGAPSSPPPSEEPAPAAQDAAGESARSVAQRLDTLLLQTAKLTTRSVDATEARSVLGGLPKDVKDAIATAADNAKQAMDKLARYTGRQIGMALLPDGDAEVVAALNAAVKAQGELSLKLHDLIRRPGLDDVLFDAVMDMALACDRRQCEIYPLAMELAEAVSASGDDRDAANLLDQGFNELLPRQAVKMHGVAEAYESLKSELKPLSDRLDDFAARPNTLLTSAELTAFSLEVGNAAVALGRFMKGGDGPARIMAGNKEILETATKLVEGAKQKLEDVRRGIGLASLKHFADNVFGIPGDMRIVFEANLDGKVKAKARALVSLRSAMRDAAKAFAEDPANGSKLQKLKGLCAEYEKRAEDADEVSKAIQALSDSAPPPAGAAQGGADELDRIAAAFAQASGMYTQVAHYGQMVASVNRSMAPEQFLTTTSARALLEGRLGFPTLVEARVHGMSGDDVNPDFDDMRPHERTKLDSGINSTVFLVKYTDDGSEWVFKPEAMGRQGIAQMALSKDYVPEEQIAHLNLATKDAAKALGAGDVSTTCSVGVNQGQYGLFMEKAPGVGVGAFAHGAAVPRGSLTAEQVKSLSPGDYAKVMGDIMRAVNRLEWLDLVTGQGDRHNSNYMIDVHDDLTVSVKGIDNDMCFPAYRTGLRTYSLRGKAASDFRVAFDGLDPVSTLFGGLMSGEEPSLPKDIPGVSVARNGTITLDTMKFESAEIHYAAFSALGAHGASLPGYIDADLCRQLTSLKAGAVRDEYLGSLAKRLPPAAVAAATSRLDEAIKLAEVYQRDQSGRVFDKDGFRDPTTQKMLVRRELAIPLPQQTGELSPFLDPAEVMKRAEKQVRSMFVRDLFDAIKVNGWLDEGQDQQESVEP